MARVRRIAFMEPVNRNISTSDSSLVSANATTDSDFTETLGRKADTAVVTTGSTASVVAMLKGILGAAGRITSVQTVDASATAWTQAAHRLFTVTGEVLVKAIFGVVDEALTGAATGSVGVSSAVNALIADTGGMAATLNAVNDIWVGRTAATGLRYIGVLDATNPSEVILSDIDIDLTISAANVTNGQITFYVIWSPISSDGDVAAAVWD